MLGALPPPPPPCVPTSFFQPPASLPFSVLLPLASSVDSRQSRLSSSLPCTRATLVLTVTKHPQPSQSLLPLPAQTCRCVHDSIHRSVHRSPPSSSLVRRADCHQSLSLARSPTTALLSAALLGVSVWRYNCTPSHPPSQSNVRAEPHGDPLSVSPRAKHLSSSPPLPSYPVPDCYYGAGLVGAASWHLPLLPSCLPVWHLSLPVPGSQFMPG